MKTKTDIKGQNVKVALVVSTFHREISQRLKAGALEELHKAGHLHIPCMEVAGVVEVPLTVQWLLEAGTAQAVVALGCVIKGETSHYDSCCRMVEQGCLQVQLKTGRPVAFGILMTHNRTQAMERSGGGKNHAGRWAARTLLKMLDVKQQIFPPKEANQKR